MKLSTLVGTLLHRHEEKQATQAAKTDTPLGLHQGSAVQIGPTEIVLAQAGGSLFPSDFKPDTTVAAVGVMRLFNRFTLYRCYIGDGTAFIEMALEDGATDPEFVRLYALQDEHEIASADEREYFLGAEPVYERQEIERTGVFKQVETSPRLASLIGWHVFARGENQEILFKRVWGAEDEDDVPVCDVTETLVQTNGRTDNVRHRMMQFGRQTEAGFDELLYADYVTDNDGDVVRVYVGFDLSKSSLTVFSS